MAQKKVARRETMVENTWRGLVGVVVLFIRYLPMGLFTRVTVAPLAPVLLLPTFVLGLTVLLRRMFLPKMRKLLLANLRYLALRLLVNNRLTVHLTL